MCHANQIQVQNMLIHFQLDGKNISSMLFPFLCEIIVPAKKMEYQLVYFSCLFDKHNPNSSPFSTCL